jgi:hypothetical protein
MIERGSLEEKPIARARPVAELDVAQQAALNARRLAATLRTAPAVARATAHCFPNLFNPSCRVFLHRDVTLTPPHRSMKPIGPPPCEEQFLAHRHGYAYGFSPVSKR